MAVKSKLKSTMKLTKVNIGFCVFEYKVKLFIKNLFHEKKLNNF